MEITKDEALNIAKQNISHLFHIEITDEWDKRWRVYQHHDLGNCWFITLMPAFSTNISSSCLIAISKETGKIVYSGSAIDEG